jgi:hypothetical protein
MEVRNRCERAIVVSQMEVGDWRERSIIRNLVERVFALDILVEVLRSGGLVRHVYRRFWRTELQGIG